VAVRRSAAALLAALTLGAVTAAAFVTADGSTRPASAQVPAAEAAAVALTHLRMRAPELGLTLGDVADVEVTDVTESSRLDVSTVHLQQRHRGLDVFGATASVTVDGLGRVVALSSNFVPGIAKLAPTDTTALADVHAVRAATRLLGLKPRSPMNRLSREPGVERESEIADGGVALENIVTRLVWQPVEGDVRIAWEVTIYELDAENWWQIRIDAASGEELGRNNLVTADSYTVFPGPIEAPSFGARTTVLDPADPTASPFGWHDLDGLAGADTTVTTGNNVDAYTDTDANNLPDPGSRPDGGAALAFDFPLDLGQPPATNTDAAVSQLFYWTNRLHDVLYAYGFDEAAGNFQLNSYGRGGLGGDPVLAEAQDGNGVNNANFATPADGIAPRMQMFLWNLTVPERDVVFDNAVVAHEYAHGVTNRLTGGPNTVTCLSNAEQPGEGWSDWFGLWMTMEPGDQGTDPRGFATWALGQPTTGAGLRAFPYSTDPLVDPRTYADIKSASIPHGVGSVFAAMLWELTWDLVDRDGFDPDLINGTGGNNTAMQLVIDGLKLQPCAPGFVDARDAILLADALGNGGANDCLIWRAFARRGLGWSADQGTSNSRADGTEAFDTPPHCTDVTLTKTAAPSSVVAGSPLTFSLTATNNTRDPLTGVTITDPLPAGVTYVDGSADCAGTFDGTDVVLNPATLPPWTSVTCSFGVVVAPGPGSRVLFVDDVEAGAGSWVATHPVGTDDWVVDTVDAHSPTSSFTASEPETVTDQVLTSAAPFPVGTDTVLRFWHRYDTENAWDGGVVEVSADGVVWTDVGPDIVSNGYPGTLNAGANPLALREAFTGDSGGWVETVVDLSAHAGSNLHVRFRFGTDDSIAGSGWRIDDISVADEVAVDNSATVTTTEGPLDSASVTVPVDPPPGFLRVTTSPAVPSTIEVDGGFTDAFGLDWVETPPGEYQLCYRDVPGFTSPPCETVTVASSVTTTATGAFVTHGTLDIRSSPPVPTTVTVDGIAVNDWGALVSIAPGNHEVCFGPVADMAGPACVTVPVTAGVVTPVVGDFTADPGALGASGHGFLRVTTSPPVPSQIVVDGNRTVSYGMDWMKLAPGAHEVCFTDVPGFDSPPCQNVAVTAGATTVLQGAFAPLAELRVLTSPALDARVTLDGRIIDQYGFWTWAPGGVEYELCADGYTCQLVTPAAGALTTVTLVP
jgi:uncharacterized repeat protein (TIGR01451 family)